MGSTAAPPLCMLVATVEDVFWHQTMLSLQYRLPDFGVIWHERYVDNRFILLRSFADPPAILDNSLSLEFYRPPVMLEMQHDQKVLGYNCDSLSRTITPQLPPPPPLEPLPPPDSLSTASHTPPRPPPRSLPHRLRMCAIALRQ